MIFRRLALILTVVTFAVAACGGGDNGDSTGGSGTLAKAHAPHEDGSPALTDQQLWEIAEQGTAASRKARPNAASPSTSKAEFIVGLKAPDEDAGVRNGNVLLSHPELEKAKAVVAGMGGVALLSEDSVLPMITVGLDTLATLTAVRDSDYVQYVDPLNIDLQLSSGGGIGCQGSKVDPSRSSRIEPGDILPWSYASHEIPQAWVRSPQAGAGTTIAVVDTGVFETQTELRMPDFNSGLSSNRQVDNIGGEWYPGHYLSPWATCDHGTREAGVVAAPRNGKNVVGVAWRANLLTIHTHDSPVALISNVATIISGIRQAIERHARVIMMAFGYPTWIDSIGSVIKYEYNRSDILFVGAAGTGVCPVGTTMFPARMNEVVSVAGVDKNHRPFPLERPWIESCSGSAVDMAAVIGNGDVETSGRDQDDVITVGGSSVATAIVTGIIALIAAEYPTWNREQIINRLFASGAGYKDPVVGYGVADAYRAVGGYSRLAIQGPNSPVAPDHGYMLRAVPHGDGPFTYRWSTGETSQSITRTMGEVGSQTTTVTVTDSREGKAISATHTVKNQQDCSQSLGPTTPSDPNMPTGTTRRECYP